MAKWSKVANAFKKRLESVAGVGHIYPYFVYTDENPKSSEFEKKFVKNKEINFITFNRIPAGQDSWDEFDDDRVIRHRGTIKFQCFYAISENSNITFKALELFDDILKAFNKLDRTLGGAINTHSLPELEDGETAVEFGGTACHFLAFTVKYETLEYRDITLEEITEEPTPTFQYENAERIGRALVEALKPLLEPEITNVVYCPTLPNLGGSGGAFGYPTDPRANLPKVEFTTEGWRSSPKAVSGGQMSEFEMMGSLVFQLLQTPGEDHHARLVRVLQKAGKSFLGTFGPSLIDAVPGLNQIMCKPTDVVVHGTLPHEFEDPSLRVSIGEIKVMVNGRIFTP